MKNIKRPKVDINEYGYLILVLLLAFGLRVWELESQSLWWDELKTVFRAELSFAELIQDLLEKRGHVPFYFWLMQGWGKLGLSSFNVRYFSVLWAVLGVASIYRLGKMLAPRQKLAKTAVFLFTISPFHIWYSQEARMYTMLPTLITIGTVFLLLSLSRSRLIDWVGYGVVMLTVVYTHYFGVLILFTHTLFIILHIRFLRSKAAVWFLTATTIGFGFSVYGFFIFRNGGYENATPLWIQPISWFDPILTLLAFSAGRTIDSTNLIFLWLFLLFCVGFIGAFLKPLRLPKLQNRLLKMWLFVPIFIVFAVSLESHRSFSLYNDRYLIISLPAFILLVAAGFSKIAERVKQRAFLPLLFVTVAGLSSFSLYNLYYEKAFARNDMRQLVEFLDEQVQTGDVILGQNDVLLPLNHYAKQREARIPFIKLPPNYVTESERLVFNRLMVRQLEQAAVNGRFWYISQTFKFSPHGFSNELDRPTDYREQWLNENLNQIESWEFPGVQLSLFDAP
ncbi:MAG: glycosyltransferase family 39 protein [Chloroflexota bacterium]